MVERAIDRLGVSTATAGLVLPLAVAVFRITSPVANLAVVIYVARLTGTEITTATMLAGGLAALAISVGTVGLPGQVSFFASIAPICLAMGVPLEVLPLLLAVEVVPDIFRTVGNVTADLAAARIVEGRDALADPEPGAGI
jgi:Na+/H+-dicarboxylate symporter